MSEPTELLSSLEASRNEGKDEQGVLMEESGEQKDKGWPEICTTERKSAVTKGTFGVSGRVTVPE